MAAARGTMVGTNSDDAGGSAVTAAPLSTPEVPRPSALVLRFLPLLAQALRDRLRPEDVTPGDVKKRKAADAMMRNMILDEHFGDHDEDNDDGDDEDEEDEDEDDEEEEREDGRREAGEGRGVKPSLKERQDKISSLTNAAAMHHTVRMRHLAAAGVLGSRGRPRTRKRLKRASSKPVSEVLGGEPGEAAAAAAGEASRGCARSSKRSKAVRKKKAAVKKSGWEAGKPSAGCGFGT